MCKFLLIVLVNFAISTTLPVNQDNVIVKSKKDLLVSCIESDLEILNNFTSRLNLIEDDKILSNESSDSDFLDLPFGSYRSDWIRLNNLHDKLPENSLLQGKLKKLFRLLAVAYLEAENHLEKHNNKLEIKNSSFLNGNSSDIIVGLQFPDNFTSESTIIYPSSDANETNGYFNATNNISEELMNIKNISIDFELSIDDKIDDENDADDFVTQFMDLIDNNTEIKISMKTVTQQTLSSNVEKFDSNHIASKFSRLNQTENKESILINPINSNDSSTERNFNFSYNPIFSGMKEKEKNWKFLNLSSTVVSNVSDNIPLNLEVPTKQTIKNFFYNTKKYNDSLFETSTGFYLNKKKDSLITAENNNNNQRVDKIKIDIDRKIPTESTTSEIIFDVPTLIYSTTENILNIKNDYWEVEKKNETFIDNYSSTLTSEKFTTSTEKIIIVNNNETEKFNVGLIKEKNNHDTLRESLLRQNFINKNISDGEIYKSQLDRANLNNNKLINLTDGDAKNKLKNQGNYGDKKTPGFNFLRKIFASRNRGSNIGKNFMRYLIPMNFLKARMRINALNK